MARRARQFGFEIDPSSMRELREKIEREFPKESARIATKYVKRATMEAALLTAREAPERTGRLWRAIYYVMYPRRHGLAVAGAVRIKAGRKKFRSDEDAFYWRWFRKGTKHMPANPFMDRARATMAPRFKQLSTEYVKALARWWNRRQGN